VNLAQNDVEYASNGSTSTSANDTSSFAYGPAGNQIQNITAALSRRVRFQAPIQVGDAFDIELSTDRIKWFTVACGAVGVNGATVQNISTQNATVYGVGRFTVVNSTDVDILFGQYAQASNSTFAGAGEAWSAGAGAGYWRVRKTSAGAAIGFSEVVPGTSAGLVSMNGLKGRTDGAAIAAGYVGQVIRCGTTANKILSTSSWQVFSDDTTGGVAGGLILTPGVWMVSLQVQYEGSNSATYYSAAISTSPTSLVSPANVGGNQRAMLMEALHMTPSSSVINKNILPMVVFNTSSNLTIYGIAAQSGGTANSCRGEFVAIRIA
jgi:hypothetical protein